jgi:hypothetical protein
MHTYHSDSPKARTKGTEMDLYQALQQNGIQFEYQRYVAFAGCGLVSETKYAFLDILIPAARLRIAAAVQVGSAHKLRVIHYNPDAYKVDGVTRKVSKAARIERLLATLHRPEPAGSLERLFLYYDECSELPGLPAVAEHWPEEVRAISALG